MAHNRRSQSALEYMLTYGWAILIIVIVAAVLWSFGVFNPSSSRSQAITGFAGLGSVQSACFNNGTLLISVGDSTGLTINITAINATSSLFSGQKFTRPNKTIIPEGSTTFGINNACPRTASSSFSIGITVTYKQVGAIFSAVRFSSGTVSGMVAGVPPTTFTERGLPTGTNWSVTYNGSTKFSTASQINFTVLTGAPPFSVPSVTIRNTCGNFYRSGNLSGSLNVGSSVTITYSPEGCRNILVGVESLNPVGKITIINDTSKSILAELPAGNYPNDAIESPDGKTAYVTAVNGNILTVVNLTSRTEIRNVTGFSTPYGLVESSDGKFIYVTNSGSNSVSIVSTASNTNVRNITVGSGPRGAAITPDGKKMFVTNFGGTSVSVVDLSANSTIKTLTSGGNVWGIQITPNGKLAYIAGWGSTKIYVLNLTTNTWTRNLTGYSNVLAVSITQDGRFLYVSSPGVNLYKINASSGVSLINKTFPGSAYMGGNAVTQDGNTLYVTSATNNIYYILNATNLNYIQNMTGGGQPRDIANIPVDSQ